MLLNGGAFGEISDREGKRRRLADGRSTLLKEFVNAFKLINSYVWSRAFETRLRKKREEEVESILWSGMYYSASSSFLLLGGPAVQAILLLTMYIFRLKQLTIEDVFTALYLFSMLNSALVVLPIAWHQRIQRKISWTRIKLFLRTLPMSELEPEPRNGSSADVANDVEISFHNASFSWLPTAELAIYGLDKESVVMKADHASDKIPRNALTLYNLQNVTIKRGSLVGIIGPSGCGKSSFLRAIMGEMNLLGGEIKRGRNRRMTFCDQRPWILNYRTMRKTGDDTHWLTNFIQGTFPGDGHGRIDPRLEDRYETVLRLVGWDVDDIRSFGEDMNSLSEGMVAGIYLCLCIDYCA